MLCVCVRIDAIHAEITSKPALELLGGASIMLSAVQVVPAILDREGTDLCPFEKLLQGVGDSSKLFVVSKDRLER